MATNKSKYKPVITSLIRHSILHRFFAIFFIFFITLSTNDAQENLLRKGILNVENLNTDIVLKDSLTILPSSIIISLDATRLETGDYKISNHQITIASDIIKNLKAKNLDYSYRVLQVNLKRSYFRLDSSMLEFKDRAVYIGYDFSPYAQEKNKHLIHSKGLNYDGSFSRGFSLGNSQSLLLNSNFNLQLSGDLGNDIIVKAAISDDNIPIQPEGNTQVLQEFDRVYIEVLRKSSNIIAGDYELRANDNYFLNYHKRLKGIKAAHEIRLTDDQYINANASFAQSQGKFARYIVPIIEGNQGPYKLQGNNNELFLVIRAGTERIYYDGRLLKRGIDEDYTISYDRAEITFMPKVLITNNSRIVAEYEYVDQNYQRTLYALGTGYKTKRSHTRLQHYSEFDSKTVRQDIQLDSIDIINLEEAGDQPNGVYVSGAALNTEEYSPARNYYEQIELNDGTLIYQYSEDIDADLFLVTFSNVGENKGSYSIDNTNAANGRTYSYVGPGLGDYDPLRQLVPPIRRSMTVLSSEFEFTKHRKIYGEASMSQLDLNRFSLIDNEDNDGMGIHFGYQDQLSIGKKKNYTLNYAADYEFISQHFIPINPYRSPEFNRDWNISDSLTGYQQIINTATSLSLGHSIKLEHEFVLFDIEHAFNGKKNIGAIAYQDSIISVRCSIDYLTTDSDTESSQFWRPKFFAEIKVPFLKNSIIGIDHFGDYNKRRDKKTTELSSLSFSFDEVKYYLKNNLSQQIQFEVGSKYREDRLPKGTTLDLTTLAREYYLSTKAKISNHSGLKLNFTIRDLHISRQDLTSLTPNQVLLGRLDYSLNLGMGALISNTNYQVGSGQEPKQEYEFVEVQRGQGNYIWIDDSPTDNIRQENEFRVDTKSDTANYVLIPIFNNEFIQTNTAVFNQSLKLNFSKILESKAENKWLKPISKVFLSSNLRLNQKTQKTAENNSFSFFNFDIQDTTIVSYVGAFNNTLFLNRGSTKWDLQLGNRLLSNKYTLITGQESRELSELFTRLRYNIVNSVDLILNASKGNLLNESQQFTDRNYDILSYSISPELNIRPSQNSRVIARYSYKDRQQRINLLEKLFANEFTLESTIRQASNASIDLSLSLIKVRYIGESSSNVAFELLEGLKDGQNFLWSLAFTKRLINNLDFIVSYEGRKTGTSRTIHTARAQVKATF